MTVLKRDRLGVTIDAVGQLRGEWEWPITSGGTVGTVSRERSGGAKFIRGMRGRKPIHVVDLDGSRVGTVLPSKALAATYQYPLLDAAGTPIGRAAQQRNAGKEAPEVVHLLDANDSVVLELTKPYDSAEFTAARPDGPIPGLTLTISGASLRKKTHPVTYTAAGLDALTSGERLPFVLTATVAVPAIISQMIELNASIVANPTGS